MNVTLHLEINGKIRRTIENCDFDKRFDIADRLKNIYPGKTVTVFYTLKSKMNNE
jgi:hypothetical protein